MERISFERKREIAESMAKDALYECVYHVTQFANHEVFECGFEVADGETPPCVGLPMFILVDDEGNAHESSDTERWAIMNILADEEM